MKSIKIVGISGAGKSTLIQAAQRRYPLAHHLGFSTLLSRFGEKGVDGAWQAALEKQHPLYLIDEHLEFGDDDLEGRYRAEKTAGIIFLSVSPGLLLARRRGDPTRRRDLDELQIVAETTLAETRAKSLAERLRIPMLILHDSGPGPALSALDRLIQTAG